MEVKSFNKRRNIVMRINLALVLFPEIVELKVQLENTCLKILPGCFRVVNILGLEF